MILRIRITPQSPAPSLRRPIAPPSYQHSAFPVQNPSFSVENSWFDKHEIHQLSGRWPVLAIVYINPSLTDISNPKESLRRLEPLAGVIAWVEDCSIHELLLWPLNTLCYTSNLCQRHPWVNELWWGSASTGCRSIVDLLYIHAVSMYMPASLTDTRERELFFSILSAFSIESSEKRCH